MVNAEFIRFSEIKIVISRKYVGWRAILFVSSKVENLPSLVRGASAERHVTETACRIDPDAPPAKPSAGLR